VLVDIVMDREVIETAETTGAEGWEEGMAGRGVGETARL